MSDRETELEAEVRNLKSLLRRTVAALIIEDGRRAEALESPRWQILIRDAQEAL